MTAPTLPGRGRLLVVAGPIGNLDDLSPRARSALAEATLVLAEDTRRTRKLLAHADLNTRMLSLPAAREHERIPGLLERLAAGECLALVTDAGTPAVSDPGCALARAALDAGHRVEPIAGASAVTVALSAAGATGSAPGFLFLGFLPRKGVTRRELLTEVGASRRPTVLFESPRRVRATLEELSTYAPDRRIVLCRELTKLHEEIAAGSAIQLLERLTDEPRGEITLVVDGAPAGAGRGEITEQELRDLLEDRLAAGDRPSEAARHAASALGIPKRRAYEMAVELAKD